MAGLVARGPIRGRWLAQWLVAGSLAGGLWLVAGEGLGFGVWGLGVGCAGCVLGHGVLVLGAG